MNRPLFEHRHFKWLAHFCANNGVDKAVIERLAAALDDTNPNYNKWRFIAAANGNPAHGSDR